MLKGIGFMKRWGYFLAILFLAGCGSEQNFQSQTSVHLNLSLPANPSGLGKPSFAPNAAPLALSTISSIFIQVGGPGMAPISTTIVVSTEGTTIVQLLIPNGLARVFSVEARNKNGILLFTGSTTQNLSGGAVSIPIELVLNQSAFNNRFVLSPGKAECLVSQTISYKLEGTLEDDSVVDLTEIATWSSSVNTPPRVRNQLHVFSCDNEGDVTIVADLGATTVLQTSLTVTPLPVVTLSVDILDIIEGTAAGTASSTFVVASSDRLLSKDVTVTLVTDGSASSTDFILPLTIIIPAGESATSVTLTTVVDSMIEPHETVIVDINMVVNGSESGQQQVIVKIIDDDLFSPQSTFAAGAEPRFVAIGDLNGDGNPDIAVVNQASNTVSVLLNTTPMGAGTATFPTKSTFDTRELPNSVDIGDLNGDGKPDLAVSNGGASNVSVLLNTTPMGATTTTFAPKADFGAAGSPISVAIGDLNGDGKPDLAVVDQPFNTIFILINETPLGTTTPAFTTQSMSFAVGSSPSSVAIGDLDGDEAPDDLAVANFNSNNVSILRNTTTTTTGTGPATFALQSTFSVELGPRFVAIGDLNDDGRPDLSVANKESNTISVLRNTTTTSGGAVTFALQSQFAVGEAPSSVAIGDLNGDGRPDLAVANQASSTVSVLLNTTPNTENTTFSPQLTFAVGSSPSSVAIGDLNRDGKADLAVANQATSAVSVLLNTTQTPAGPLIIDDFSACPQNLSVNSAGPSATHTATGCAGVIGSKRVVDLQHSGGSGAVTVPVAGQGNDLFYTEDSTADGQITLTYDPGPFDLTSGGANNQFVLGFGFVNSPSPLLFNMVVMSAAGTSTFSGEILPIPSPSFFNIPFASLTGSADLSAVTSLKFTFDSAQGDGTAFGLNFIHTEP